MSKLTRIKLLQQLGIWDRLSQAEKNTIRYAKNDVQREQYYLFYIKKYL